MVTNVNQQIFFSINNSYKKLLYLVIITVISLYRTIETK